MNTNIPNSSHPRVVIIGAGFAGLNLIKKLGNKPFQVIIIDRYNYHCFQPLLYQVATGGLEPSSIAHPIRKFANDYNNVLLRVAEVSAINAKENYITTSIGDISYDYLVLATGTKTNFFGKTGAAQNAMELKSIPDALDLRTRILENLEKALLTTELSERDRLMNFVIVGGGPTGVELAGALGELKKHVLIKDYPELDLRRMQINLIESSSEVLDAMSDEASAKSRTYLEELGVSLWLNTKVNEYDGSTATLNNGESIATATLVWTAGVESALPDGLPAELLGRGKRVKVNEFNQILGYENAFAVGDACLQTEPNFENGYPQIAPVAIQQATQLGKNLLRITQNQAPTPFSYHHQGNMATVGRNRAVVDLKLFKSQGLFAWFVWMFVHLITLIGFRNKLIVFTNWFWNYLSYDRHLRLIIRPMSYYTKKD